MRQSKALIVLLIVIGLGCEKEIPYDEQTYIARLVVNGMIQAGEAIRIDVTESASILTDFGHDYLEIDDCQVRLFENGTLVESLSSGIEGLYTFSHIALASVTYRIELDHNRLPSASCEVKMPGSVGLSEATGIVGDDFESEVTLIWPDSDNANYYQILMYQTFQQSTDTSLIGWTTTSAYFGSDPLGDGDSYYWDDAMLLDELFKDGNAELALNINLFINPDEPESMQVIAVLLGCSESYYRYRSSLRLYQESDGGLFSQPVQIFSNVEGGLGVLGASSKSVMSVEF